MGRLLRVIEVSEAHINSYAHDGFTLTRETLLTPEQTSVIAAAKAAEQTLTDMAHAEAIYGGQIRDDVLALIDATITLRAQEGA